MTDFSPRSPSTSPSRPSSDGDNEHDGNPDRGYDEEQGGGPQFYNFPRRTTGTSVAIPLPKVPARETMTRPRPKAVVQRWVPKKVQKAGTDIPPTAQKEADPFPKGTATETRQKQARPTVHTQKVSTSGTAPPYWQTDIVAFEDQIPLRSQANNRALDPMCEELQFQNSVCIPGPCPAVIPELILPAVATVQAGSNEALANHSLAPQKTATMILPVTSATPLPKDQSSRKVVEPPENPHHRTG